MRKADAPQAKGSRAGVPGKRRKSENKKKAWGAAAGAGGWLEGSKAGWA